MKQKVKCSKEVTMERFAEQVKNMIQIKAGDGASVVVQSVCKNNAVTLTGLSIFREGSNISPTVYLEEYYERYLEGSGMNELAEEIMACYREHCISESFDADFYMDYARVRERLAYRLINREKNERLLGEIPHIPYLDLEIVFFCRIENDELGCGIIQVRNEHLRFWEVETEQLFADAENNMRRLYPEMVCTIMELLCSQDKEDGTVVKELPECGIPMYIVSNMQKAYGAAAILYDGLIEGLAQRLDSDLALLPSSVHEMIAVPVDGEQQACGMLGMVCEINATQVEPEEVLADSLYYYERKSGNLIVIH